MPSPTRASGILVGSVEFWLPLACPKEFLDILGVPAASLQRGSNRAAVTGSSSSRKKRLSVSVTSSTKCSPGRSFTDRASLRKSARSRRLRARAPPFRYTPSRRRPENSQCLYSLLPKHPPSTQHPTCDTPARHSTWLLGAQRGGNLLPWSCFSCLCSVLILRKSFPNHAVTHRSPRHSLSPHHFYFQ